MDQKQNQENKNFVNPQTQGFPQKETNWATPKGPADEVSRTISEVASSIRILEDRYLNLRRKSQITDQNLIELQKEYFKEKKHINQELLEDKMKLQDLIEDLKVVKGELKDTVKQKDLKVINKYLDYWEPLQFVTRQEVEKIINKE